MTHVLRKLSVSMLACAMLAACGPSAQEPVSIEDPWANATPVGASVAAVYLQLIADEPDTLLAASTTVADHIEMHASREENGMMTMRPLATVDLEARKPFSFAPGGAHFMLMGLRQPLVAGMRIPMTLEFQRAGAITVQVQIVELGSR
ncbi:MAG: copper chaperone PCu(A)C [Steroidobacter sp.]